MKPEGELVAPTFPAVNRVELVKPPLEMVVAQVRFPTVLQLAEDRAPLDFQHAIKADCPISKRPSRQEDPSKTAAGQVWSFESMDSSWTVTLSHNFLALETPRYRTFEEFRTRFQRALEAAITIYSIEIQERLGLRYIDRLTRTAQPGLPPDWYKFVRTELAPLGPLRESSDHLLTQLESRFKSGDRFLAIRSAFIEAGYSGAADSELVLDFDCYREGRRAIAGASDELKEFKDVGYRAFRWAIGDLIKYLEVKK